MITRRNHKRAGFTLVELAIAAALVASLLGGIALATVNSSGAVTESISQGEVDKLTGRVLDRLIDEFESSIRTSLNPVGPLTTASSERIDYQRSMGWNGATVDVSPTTEIILELAPGELDNGIDDDGDGLIDQGRVIRVENPGLATEQRVTLAKGVAEYLEGEIPDGANDENGNGLVDERGLCFVLDGNELTIRLTLMRASLNGRTYVSTAESSVFLRN